MEPSHIKRRDCTELLKCVATVTRNPAETIFVVRFTQFRIKQHLCDAAYLHNRRTWTLLPIIGLAQEYPYLSPKAIRESIDDLVTESVLRVDGFSELSLSNARWVAFNDELTWLGIRSPE